MISSEVSTLRVSEPECSCVGGGLMIVWPEWRWKRGGGSWSLGAGGGGRGGVVCLLASDLLWLLNWTYQLARSEQQQQSLEQLNILWTLVDTDQRSHPQLQHHSNTLLLVTILPSVPSLKYILTLTRDYQHRYLKYTFLEQQDTKSNNIKIAES